MDPTACLLAACDRLHDPAAVAEALAALDAGADARAEDNYALRMACVNGYHEIVDRLIALGLTVADARALDNHALRDACVYGHLEVVDRLLTLGLGADDVRAYRNYALRGACMNGHLEVVDRLIDLGLTADDARVQNNDALRVACKYGHLEVVARLLELGVEPTPAALTALSAVDTENREVLDRVQRALEVWNDTPELEAAEVDLDVTTVARWEEVKEAARPAMLRFSD